MFNTQCCWNRTRGNSFSTPFTIAAPLTLTILPAEFGHVAESVPKRILLVLCATGASIRAQCDHRIERNGTPDRAIDRGQRGNQDDQRSDYEGCCIERVNAVKQCTYPSRQGGCAGKPDCHSERHGNQAL